MDSFAHLLLHFGTSDPAPDRLRLARERGIITQAQYDAILALDVDAPSAGARAPTREAPRGFNWVGVAYSVGAAIVLFAFGWFLIDRWRALGPAGILAIVAGFAALLVVAAVMLRREGFAIAAAIAITLAVALTPLASWAVMRLTGFWPPDRYADPLWRFAPYMAPRWMVVELSTILVALLVLQRVRVGILAAPIAVAMAFLAVHLGELLFAEELHRYLQPWVTLVVGTIMLAIGYALDRRTDPAEDFARWFYLAGVVTVIAGYGGVWSAYRESRHALPLLALVALAASLYLRRRVFLLAGMLGIFWYLGYLAFDVFDDVLGFPVLLASFGLSVILVTVLVQRRYPDLARRLRASRGDTRPSLPGGYATALAPIALTLLLLAVVVPRARARYEADEARARREMARMRREMREARARDRARGQPTPPERAPAPPPARQP